MFWNQRFDPFSLDRYNKINPFRRLESRKRFLKERLSYYSFKLLTTLQSEDWSEEVRHSPVSVELQTYIKLTIYLTDLLLFDNHRRKRNYTFEGVCSIPLWPCPWNIKEIIESFKKLEIVKSVNCSSAFILEMSLMPLLVIPLSKYPLIKKQYLSKLIP